MNKFYAFFIAILLFASCRKEATRWNSNWSAPLLNDTLTLMNWVNDSTLTTNSSGYYMVDLKRELFRFDLNSIVGIPDTTLQNNFSIPGGLSVPPGFSFVNQTEERDLMLNPIELTKIHLKAGEIAFIIKNPYPTKVTCAIILPGVTRNGNVVSATLEVAAGSLTSPTEGIKSINLADAQMDLSGLTGGGSNRLLSTIKVTSDPNGPSVVSTSAYVTQVFASIKNIKLDYAKGYFGQQTFSDTVETDVEILKKWVDGNIHLPNLSLNLKLSNGIKAMGRINIKEVTTTKVNGTSTTLISSQINSPKNVNSASGSWSNLSPSQTDYNFHTVTSNIKTFLENAGPKIKVVYEFTINPFGNISGSWNEIFPQSAVKLDLNLKMPLSLALDNLTITDTFNLDLTSYQKQIDQGRTAEFVVDVNNSFPIQGGLWLKFIDQGDQTILGMSEFETIESGLFGTGAKTSTFNWKIKEEYFKKLSSATRIVVLAKFNTPDPVTMNNSSVFLSEDCFLGCKLRMNLQYEAKYE